MNCRDQYFYDLDQSIDDNLGFYNKPLDKVRDYNGSKDCLVKMMDVVDQPHETELLFDLDEQKFITLIYRIVTHDVGNVEVDDAFKSLVELSISVTGDENELLQSVIRVMSNEIPYQPEDYVSWHALNFMLKGSHDNKTNELHLAYVLSGCHKILEKYRHV